MNPLPLPTHQITTLLAGKPITWRTRIEPQPIQGFLGSPDCWCWLCPNSCSHVWGEGRDPMEVAFMGECSPIKVGDRFWVQEQFYLCQELTLGGYAHGVIYYSDFADDKRPDVTWNPAEQLPQELSRLAITTTHVGLWRGLGKWWWEMRGKP